MARRIKGAFLGRRFPPFFAGFHCEMDCRLAAVSARSAQREPSLECCAGDFVRGALASLLAGELLFFCFFVTYMDDEVRVMKRRTAQEVFLLLLLWSLSFCRFV